VSIHSILIFTKDISPALTTLLAGWIGVTYGLRQIRINKELDFIKEQITNLYSPLLGIQKEIRAKSELRITISQAADDTWREICENHPKPFLDSDKYIKSFEKIIGHENEHFEIYLFPLYKRMLNIFRDNYHLAEDPTRKWFKPFCDYVELWDRLLNETIPKEVVTKIGLDEATVNPFYNDLENTLDMLISRIKGKRA